MRTTTPRARLAYDDEGTGVPLVLLHGLTFDRRTWRPVLDRLDGAVRTVTVDLPAHGESTGGSPGTLEELADDIHELVIDRQIDRPIVVGHSFGAALACCYVSIHASRGLVTVDDGPVVQPFAELLHRMEPVLRGPDFLLAWEPIEASLCLERIPEPVRSVVVATHRVDQETVLAFWDQALSTEPAALQEYVDEQISAIDVPWLAVFGRGLTTDERHRLTQARAEVEEWRDEGHFVHLVDVDRFSHRLRRFVDRCTTTPSPRPRSSQPYHQGDGHLPHVRQDVAGPDGGGL